MTASRPIAIVMAAACAVGASTAAARDSGTRVQLLRFDPPDTSETAGARAPQPLRSQLLREFSQVASLPDATTFPDRQSLASFPRIRAPGWMRSGRTLSSVPTRVQPSSVEACSTNPYRPSNLLASRAEERRRLLYPLVQQAACEAGLPVGLMDAMLIEESGYNPLALSRKGAFGLGQLMPETARQLGIDRFDLRENLAGAARYLRQHIDEFGQVPLALAAYNAGPAGVRKRWRVPSIAETQEYVRRILQNWMMLEQRPNSMTSLPNARHPHRAVLVSQPREVLGQIPAPLKQ